MPLYAREIATELTAKGIVADRTSVNRELYGALAEEVVKGRDHRWKLAAAMSDGASAPHAPVLPSSSAKAGRGASPKRPTARPKKDSKPADASPAVDVVLGEEPTCPKCGGSMVKRTARRGRDAGKQFWGCEHFPGCRGTVSIAGAPRPADEQSGRPGSSESAEQPPAASSRSRLPLPVTWSDATVDPRVRPGWVCRHAMVGASLRAIPGSQAAFRPLAACWIARPDTGVRKPSEGLRRFSGSIMKVLQRGVCPPLHPFAERLLLEDVGLAEKFIDPLPGELAVRLTELPAINRGALRDLWGGEPPIVDSQIACDSDEEWLFLADWAPKHLDPVTVRSIIPQAPLDALARAAGLKQRGMRRVDFLVQPDQGDPFVVEIDGSQHEDAEHVDAERDALLAELGLPVVRVPASEMRELDGPRLQEIIDRCGTRDGSAGPSRSAALLIQGPALVHRTVLALVEAMSAGLLTGDDWVVEIDDPFGVVPTLLPPYLDMMAASDILASAGVMPAAVEIRSEREPVLLTRDGSRYYLSGGEPSSRDPDIAVLLEPHLSPLEELGDPGEVPVIVVRSAHIPVRIADPFLESSQRAVVDASPEDSADALEVLLQAIFAKQGFRDGQLTALQRVIAGDGCAVLLPTGAGKSLIYQLAGLVLPGRTIVIDPIVALMEDQVRGLRLQGIDRVADVSSVSMAGGGRADTMERVASGDALFIFMAPERLQQASFREALRSLAQRTIINVAVVDEAHCVSEWGHDFRTAYLNLGRILREHLSSGPGDPGPPTLALTGTASRAVLRDVLNELEMGVDDGDAIIQPHSFDRPELSYRIQSEAPANAVAALVGAVAAMPGEFGLPPPAFFHSRGDETMSGLVFCPHANGRFGVVSVAEELGRALQVDVPFYAGGAPRGWDTRDWEVAKRRFAESFKDNSAPLLVATKAFGMGIDKPNVRYVVHLGIPTSIEAYYQEVGRAGRDRQRSECVLVSTEYDEGRARRMLAEDADLERVRAEHDEVQRSGSDDVTNALYFLLNSFIGEDAERSLVGELLDLFDGKLGTAATVFVPMASEGRDVERGLHRLVLLGVLRDYLVDWGGKRYQAELAACTSRSIFERLIQYVRRSQPGQADQIESELGRIEGLPLETAIAEASERLIRFIYDTVERSRRRSLREMWLAAREGRDDPNSTFRQRILDYLTQGDVAPTLEMLAEKDKVSFDDWTSLLDDVWQDTLIAGADPARELRGGTGRLLGSYPDHPGLLLARGVSEVLMHDGDLQEFESNLVAARRSAVARYGLVADEIAALDDWLVRRARDWKSSGMLTAVVIAADEDSRLPLLDALGPDDFAGEAGLAVLALERQLEEARASITELTEMLTQ